MEELVGKKIKVILYVDHNRRESFTGMVKKVENNLIFLTDIVPRDIEITPDQIVNTQSVAFIRLEILK